jgi:hypothetical protein
MTLNLHYMFVATHFTRNRDIDVFYFQKKWTPIIHNSAEMYKKSLIKNYSH